MILVAKVPAPSTLFLVHRAPWPPDRGDRIRSWHLFEALRKLGPVHIAALADSEADATIARAKLEPLTASTHIAVRRTSRVTAMALALLHHQPASLPLFADAGLAAHVRALIAGGGIDRIVAFSSQMAQYVPDDCHLPFVMDFVDVDSAKFSAYAADDKPGPMRWVHAREGRRLAAFEKSVARAADLCLFVSDAEAALFRARTGLDDRRVRALENGIDLDRFSPDGDWQPLSEAERGNGPLAVFTGQMDYRPNIEAVTYFARNTLPLLQKAETTARFAIVGRAPTPEVRALAAIPGVTVTGEVPDTRPWLAAASAVAAPLAVARGVQNKLLEAMAMARAVVASPSAAQGIDATDGTHLLVADGAVATAEAVTTLMHDPQRGDAIGRAARQRMVDRYNWDATLAPLAQFLPGTGWGTMRSMVEGQVRRSATVRNNAVPLHHPAGGPPPPAEEDS